MAKTITLITDFDKGTTKEYKAKKLSSLYIMKAMRIGKKLEEQNDNIDINIIEELLDMIVEVYNDQFTKDEMLAGIPSEDFMKFLEEQMIMIATPEIDSTQTKDFLDKK